MYYSNQSPGDFVPYHPEQRPRYDPALTEASLRKIFSRCDDFSCRSLRLGGAGGPEAAFLFIDGLIDGDAAAETVLRPATALLRLGDVKSPEEALERILQGEIYGVAPQKIQSTDEAVEALLGGNVLLLLSRGMAVAFELRSDSTRSVEAPKAEQSVKGAKDAFVETLRVNTALLRRHLRTPELKFEPLTLGRRSNTPVAIVYLEGVCNETLPEKLRQRLEALEVDGLVTVAALEAALSTSPRSPFPQLMSTERPDRFCLNLLEGRVGLLVDGQPLGWLMPATLHQQLRVPEDLNRHHAGVSALTALRYLALVITLLFPALYVAVAMYHPEMIPARLLMSVIESKRSVPFSTAAEVLGMLIAFALLQEAGLRLPSSIGQTVSIIGALIVGQSAVEAKVISPIAVIVVATAGIAGYTLPDQDLGQALRLMRFLMVLAAIGGGIFGIAGGLLALLWHLCALDSFGVAYLAPAADGGPFTLPGSLLRKPPWKDVLRDRRLKTPNRRRRK